MAFMADKPVHFDSLDELIRARPAFDPVCMITRENLLDLPGKYDFQEDAPCQVESIKVKDHLCRNPHRSGWLGRRKDGKEGLIGSTCGPKYFHEHKGFAANRAFVKRELDLDSLTEQLRAIEADNTNQPKIDQLRERPRIVREQSQELLASLPEDVAIRLRAMAKARNADIRIEIEFIEKLEDEARSTDLVDQGLGLPDAALQAFAELACRRQAQ
jgi:hypothetical protein